MSHKPVAFMSYVRLDDQHEAGRLTQFRERLSGEVRMQTGEAFDIFQDRNDIAWGQQWKKRIDESLDAVTFLIPIITPAFFKSPACREEFERFLKREEKLDRTDLILPVYYVECGMLSDEAKREKDPLAKAIGARRYAEWRELRFEPFTSPEVGKRLAGMARQIVEALERSQPAPAPSTAFGLAVASADTARRSVAQSGQTREVDIAAVSESPRAPAPKTEVPTLVVDALYRGDYPTLTAALAAAKAGTRILVRPGLYKEGVVIDKPVEIVGDGEQADVVIEAFGKDAILFQTSMGRVANLTLRQTGGGDWYCVDIAQGRLDLEGCDITSQSLSCVAIHGGADPRLRRNRIHDGKSAGVVVYDDGQGTLEDNEIFANVHTGVQIKTGSNPTLRRNRIHDGKSGGVYVHENGQGALEDNEISANANAGVYIESGGNPNLRGNRISKNSYEGIWVGGDGGGDFEGNDLRDNAKGAWCLDPGSETKVKRENNRE